MGGPVGVIVGAVAGYVVGSAIGGFFGVVLGVVVACLVIVTAMAIWARAWRPPAAWVQPYSRDDIGRFLVKHFPLRDEPGRFDLPRAARYYGVPLLPALKEPRYSPDQTWALGWTSHRLEHAAFEEPPCTGCTTPWSPANHPPEVTTDLMAETLAAFDQERKSAT
jgi:hypothetical protein